MGIKCDSTAALLKRVAGPSTVARHPAAAARQNSPTTCARILPATQELSSSFRTSVEGLARTLQDLHLIVK